MDEHLTIARERLRRKVEAPSDNGQPTVWVTEEDIAELLTDIDVSFEALHAVANTESLHAVTSMVADNTPLMSALESAYIEGFLVGLEISRVHEEVTS